MDAGWIILVRNQGKVTRMMISIFLKGMYSVYSRNVTTGFESKLDRSRRQRPRLRWVEDM